MDKETAIARIKLLLNDEELDDTLLDYLIDDAVNQILAYCHRRELPEPLYTLVPIIVVAKLRTMGAVESEVKSISQGERTVSLTTSLDYQQSFINERDFINDYAERLEPFVIRKGFVPSDFTKGV